MKIGGLQKLSLLDYPDYPSAIIFTQGCNFRCQFCYNPMLVWPYGGGKFKKDHHLLEEGDLFDFLKKRQGKLAGVVITGGEPTIHKDLPEFIKKIKDLGFKIKLDTNGTNPEMLKKLIPPTPFKKGGLSDAPLIKGGEGGFVDYIAMDLKAPLEKYEKITGVYPVKSGEAGAPPLAGLFNRVDLEKIQKSIKLIIKSGLPSEFRTTVVPGLINKDDIAKMGELIKGADKWFLQRFKSNIDLVNKKLESKKAFTEKEMEELVEIGKQYTKKCEVR